MSVLPQRRSIHTINAIPYSHECRPIREIVGRTVLSDLFLRTGSAEGVHAYMRVIEASVPVGLHATNELEVDGSEIVKGEDLIAVSEVCQGENRCENCIFRMSKESLSGVEPSEVLRALARATKVFEMRRAID